MRTAWVSHHPFTRSSWRTRELGSCKGSRGPAPARKERMRLKGVPGSWRDVGAASRAARPERVWEPDHSPARVSPAPSPRKQRATASGPRPGPRATRPKKGRSGSGVPGQADTTEGGVWKSGLREAGPEASGGPGSRRTRGPELWLPGRGEAWTSGPDPAAGSPHSPREGLTTWHPHSSGLQSGIPAPSPARLLPPRPPRARPRCPRRRPGAGPGHE